MGQWWGQGHARHDLVARGAFGAGVASDGFTTADPQVIAVVDVGQRSRERLLAFDWPGRSKGCCSVLGWSDPGVLLFTSVGDGPTRILGWDVGTGRLYRVSEVTPRDGRVHRRPELGALAVAGCERRRRRGGRAVLSYPCAPWSVDGRFHHRRTR